MVAAAAVIRSSDKSSTVASMWFINFVLVVGTLISLLVFGWATYLEGSHPLTKVMHPIADPVPLPISRPKPKDALQEAVENVVESQQQPAKQRRTRLRHETW
jgi:hypothetical protein